MFLTALIVYNGVEKGIERVSKFIMPVLLLMVIGIAIFSLTLKHPLDDGTVRTGLQGLKVYLTPDVKGLTVTRFLQISLDAMSQLFFSLSVSMGIMITYGSYVKKDVNLNKSISQIELMDTGVALLAGVMIIPAVYVFSGLDGMSAGPGLMFISLPNVFYSMGLAGRLIGLMFFILTAFAALTSCISVLESITANCMELFHAEHFNGHLSGCNRNHCNGLQHILCGSAAAKRKHRTVIRHHGLYQQQFSDAVYRTALIYSDWMDRKAILDCRGDGVKW